MRAAPSACGINSVAHDSAHTSERIAPPAVPSPKGVGYAMGLKLTAQVAAPREAENTRGAAACGSLKQQRATVTNMVPRAVRPQCSPRLHEGAMGEGGRNPIAYHRLTHHGLIVQTALQQTR